MRKNGKTKEIVLSMVGYLVAMVIGCQVLVLEAYRTAVMVAVIVIWVAVLWWKLKKETGKQKEQQKERAMQIIDLEPDYKKLFFQQIQLRVQEKLRMKFPGAAVDLCEKELERLATLGKAVYVPIRKADDYCHMSITLKSSGDIQMNLFSLVSLENAHETKVSEVVDLEVDVEQWYSQKGQLLLTELITNMNTRGYTELSINENGDVTVKENGRNIVKDRFQEIPPKKQWTKLKKLMADEDVQVQVSGKQLNIAW